LQKVAKIIINLSVNIVTILLVEKVVGQNTFRPKNTLGNRYPNVIHLKWITKKLQIGISVSAVKVTSL
jgi:hypothetical protein